MWLNTRTRTRRDELLGRLPAALKISLYTLYGYKIGRGVKFGPGSGVAGREVEIGDGASIGAGSFVRGEKIRIGRGAVLGERTLIKARRVEIGDGAQVTSRVRVTGFEHPDSAFIMGRNSILMYDSYVDTSRRVVIGEDSGVGGHCLLFTHAAWLSAFEGYPVEFEGIEIGNGAWLPWRVTVLPGSRVGAGTVIGTNSVVRSRIPDGCFAAGTPARVIRGPGAYRRPSRDERATLLRGIMDEFAECVQMNGLRVRKDGPAWEFEEPQRLFKRSRRQVAFVAVERPPSLRASGIDLYVSLDRLPAELRHELDARAIPWLDLDARQRSARLSTVGRAFSDFVARYGVRFTVG